MVFHGTARVDDPGALSEKLAEEVTKKAFKLLVTVEQMDGEGYLKHYECQIGLIRQDIRDPITVRPATAKHNIANAWVKGVLECFEMAELRIPKRDSERLQNEFSGSGL